MRKQSNFQALQSILGCQMYPPRKVAETTCQSNAKSVEQLHCEAWIKGAKSLHICAGQGRSSMLEKNPKIKSFPCIL